MVLRKIFGFLGLFAAVLIITLTSRVQAEVVFSNLPMTGAVSGLCLSQFDVAVGFTVPGGDGYTLNSVTVGVNRDLTDGTLTLGIFADNSGEPGSSLLNLGTQPVTATGEYTFPGTLALTAGLTYWVVATSADSTCQVTWESNGEAVPTGAFTFAGFLYDDGGGWDSAAFAGQSTALSVDATENVPEPEFTPDPEITPDPEFTPEVTLEVTPTPEPDVTPTFTLPPPPPNCPYPLVNGSVQGRMLSSTIALYEPNAGSTTDVIIPVGSSWWIIDTVPGFYQLWIACEAQPIWVQALLMIPNFDAVWNGAPLPDAGE